MNNTTARPWWVWVGSLLLGILLGTGVGGVISIAIGAFAEGVLSMRGAGLWLPGQILQPCDIVGISITTVAAFFFLSHVAKVE